MSSSIKSLRDGALDQVLSVNEISTASVENVRPETIYVGSTCIMKSFAGPALGRVPNLGNKLSNHIFAALHLDSLRLGLDANSDLRRP